MSKAFHPQRKASRRKSWWLLNHGPPGHSSEDLNFNCPCTTSLTALSQVRFASLTMNTSMSLSGEILSRRCSTTLTSRMSSSSNESKDREMCKALERSRLLRREWAELDKATKELLRGKTEERRMVPFLEILPKRLMVNWGSKPLI